MNLILLSGGSGKRLWPLSNESRSKQFLKLLNNKEGQMESMIQRVWSQLVSAGLADSAIITTSASQVEMIAAQIGHDVTVLVEPVRRDTFPAIALAAAYLHSVRHKSGDEVVVVQPVDPYVENSFFDNVKEMESLLTQSQADVVLIGAAPTYPSSKYGYMVPFEQQQEDTAYVRISHFKEKPSEQQAERLIAEKALWNCGVFAFRLGYMISLLQGKGLPISYEDLLRHYHLMPKTSFDYEVLEKSNNLVALPYYGSWKDLGTWNTLTEEVPSPLIGNGWVSEDSTNTHLINELDIPVTVLGVPNIVVAVSADGVLVADKKASPRIKEIPDETLNANPKYMERSWGSCQVLDTVKSNNDEEVVTNRMRMEAGKHISYHVHNHQDEVWVIIRGVGEYVLHRTLHQVHPGAVIRIPAGVEHGIRAQTDLEWLEIQFGLPNLEKNTRIVISDWEQIVAHIQQ